MTPEIPKPGAAERTLATAVCVAAVGISLWCSIWIRALAWLSTAVMAAIVSRHHRSGGVPRLAMHGLTAALSIGLIGIFYSDEPDWETYVQWIITGITTSSATDALLLTWTGRGLDRQFSRRRDNETNRSPPDQ